MSGPSARHGAVSTHQGIDLKGSASANTVIGLYPYDTPGNDYIARNREILGLLGSVVEVPRARRLLGAVIMNLLRLKSPRLFDVAILNWPERLLVLHGDTLTTRGVIEYFLFLRLIRIASRRLVYVRHNKTAHGIAREHRERVARLIDKGEGLSDAVVCHSPAHAESHGYLYVPHPLYTIASVDIAKPNDEYLVFGRVAPYKHIDRLIAAWAPKRTLAVVGPSADEGYLERLRQLADGKAIRFDIGFREADEAAARIAASRGIIIVNDQDSAIVSGSFFFAVSSGARVLALSDPFYTWIASTRLGDHVDAFASISALVRHVEVAADEPGEEAARRSRAVRDEAAELFGDDVVREAWRSVFSAVGVPAGGCLAAPVVAGRS